MKAHLLFFFPLSLKHFLMSEGEEKLHILVPFKDYIWPQRREGLQCRARETQQHHARSHLFPRPLQRPIIGIPILPPRASSANEVLLYKWHMLSFWEVGVSCVQGWLQTSYRAKDGLELLNAWTKGDHHWTRIVRFLGAEPRATCSQTSTLAGKVCLQPQSFLS